MIFVAILLCKFNFAFFIYAKDDEGVNYLVNSIVNSSCCCCFRHIDIINEIVYKYIYIYIYMYVCIDCFFLYIYYYYIIIE